MEQLADPENAINYLDVSLEEYQVDGDTDFFLMGIQNVRQSGHGQGSTQIVVPEYIAAYALHLTASNILLLAKANEDMK